MMNKLIMICTFLMVLFQVKAQEPNLPVKDISINKQLKGDKQAYEYGWKEMLATGKASSINGSFVVKCDSGEMYAFRGVQKSKVAFAPTGSFTVEFKVKVLNSNGRGMDVSFKTRDFSSPTIYFSHKYVGVASPKLTLSKVNGAEFRTYRLAVSKEDKKIYVYADGKFLGAVEITDFNGATPYLSFGKGHKAANAEIHLDYISFDLTGAFKPN